MILVEGTVSIVVGSLMLVVICAYSLKLMLWIKRKVGEAWYGIVNGIPENAEALFGKEWKWPGLIFTIVVAIVGALIYQSM